MARFSRIGKKAEENVEGVHHLTIAFNNLCKLKALRKTRTSAIIITANAWLVLTACQTLFCGFVYM